MDYVARLTFRASVSGAARRHALMRRAGWEYPAGIRVIAEYWPMADDVQVVAIFSSDDIAAIWDSKRPSGATSSTSTCHPRCRRRTVSRIGPDVFGRLRRLEA